MEGIYTNFRYRIEGMTPVWTMKPKEDDPKVNNTITITHCFIKGFQAAGLIWYPIMAVMATRKGANVRKLLRIAGGTSILSGALVAAGGAYRVSTSTDVRNYDRAFRLQHNVSQNKVDWHSVYGGGLGGATWLLLFGVGSLPGGIALGAGAGVIVHVVDSIVGSAKNKPPKEAAKEAVKEVKEDIKDATKVLQNKK